MHKILYKFSIMSLLLTVAFVVYVSYINIFPSNNFYLEKPITIDNSSVKRGDILPVNLSYCKKTNRKAKITYQLINGQVINLSQVDVVDSSTCSTKTDFVEIPHTIPPSQYKLIINVSYERSLFKVETYHYETPLFNIK